MPCNPTDDENAYRRNDTHIPIYSYLQFVYSYQLLLNEGQEIVLRYSNRKQVDKSLRGTNACQIYKRYRYLYIIAFGGSREVLNCLWWSAEFVFRTIGRPGLYLCSQFYTK